MLPSLLSPTLRTIAARYPGVVPHLSRKTKTRYWIVREPYKTYDYFLSTLERMIRNVYNGNMGGDFIGALEDLVLGQISQAFERAWADEEGEGDVPEYLRDASQAIVLEQYQHIDGLYKDIIDARVDEAPVDPLLSRAALWANQWTSAYNEAVRLIALDRGGNLVWREGDTIQKCSTCVALDGIVMSAKEWEASGVHPQGFPNDKLQCKGGHCDCRLEPTDQRRSPKAFTTVMNIIEKG